MKKIIVYIAAVMIAAFTMRAQEGSPCGTIETLPWGSDFSDGLGCWTDLGDQPWQTVEYNGEPAVATSLRNKHYVLMSPAVVLPEQEVFLHWMDKRYSAANQSYHVLVSADAMADLADYDTLFTQVPATVWNDRSLSLANYAGQTVYIAFVVDRGNNSGAVYLANMQIYNDLMPLGYLGIQSLAQVGEEVSGFMTLYQGETEGLTCSWHSTLLDSDLEGGEVVDGEAEITLTYDVPGIDTLSVTVANAYGSITIRSVMYVYECGVVSEFPWTETFEPLGSHFLCWIEEGFIYHNNNYSGSVIDEDGGYYTYNNYLQVADVQGEYLVTPPIAVPAGATDLAFALGYSNGVGSIDVRVLAADAIDTADAIGVLPSLDCGTGGYMVRKVRLDAYAGQTVRLAFINRSSLSTKIYNAWIDYDTLPKLHAMTLPAKAVVGHDTLCTASLRYGSTEGLHYNWHSALGGTFTTNALGDSAWVTYSGGFGDTDTITVYATNAYGTDSLSKTIHLVDCTPQVVLPWRETFADGLVCWYRPEGSNWVDMVPGYYQESYRLMASNCNAEEGDHWVMSKAITLPDDPGLNVNLFWDVAGSNTSYHHNYRVLVSTGDYTDTNTYVEVYRDTMTHVNHSNFDHLKTSLVQFAGQTIHVAFCNHSTATNSMLYIDNVTVRTASKPVVSLAGPTVAGSHEPVTYTATLAEGSSNWLTYHWRSSLMDSTWNIAGDSEGCESDVFYTISGTDTLRVVAENAYGTDTALLIVTVNDCTPLALPWTEDFNGISGVAYNVAGSMPNCWRHYWNGSNATYAPHVISSYSYGSIGSVAGDLPLMLLAGGASSGCDSVAIVETPAFAEPINGSRLSFFRMYEASGYGVLSVGYMQNGEFVKLCDASAAISGRDTVILNGIPDNVRRIALKWKYLTSWYAVVVDNIVVEQPSPEPEVSIVCAQTAFVGDTLPVALVFTDGILDDVTCTWHSSLMGSTWTTFGTAGIDMLYNITGTDTLMVVVNNLYGVDSSYAIVSVSAHPIPSATINYPYQTVLVPATFTPTVTLNDCSANGLTVSWHSSLTGEDYSHAAQPSLTYGWQREYTMGGKDTVTCTVSNNYGYFVCNMIVYAVDCNAYGVPYTETFENTNAGNVIPTCWQRIWNGTDNAAQWGPRVGSGSQYPFSSHGSHYLWMRAGSSNGYDTVAYAILPQFGIDLGDLTLAFWYGHESTGAGTLTVGYMAGEVFTPLADMQPVGSNGRRDTISFADADVPDGARIAFRWKYLLSSYYDVAIDDISVFQDEVLHAPRNLHVDSLGAACARLAWASDNNADAFHVVISGIVDTVVNENMVTLCGLTPTTQYNVSVFTVIGDETSASASLSFTTLCNIVDLPWNENFDGIGSLACWSAGENTYVNLLSSFGDSFYNQYCHSGTNALDVFCYSEETAGLVATPLIEYPADALLVSFWACVTYGPGTMEVGVMTDRNDPETFIPLAEFQMVEGPGYYNSPAYFEFDTRNAGVSDFAAVAFRCSSDHDFVIDDISVEALPTCVRPRDLVAQSVDAHTATVAWTTSADGFPVQTLITLHDLTAGGNQEYYAEQDGEQGEYTLTDLAAGHIYRAELQTVCSPDEVSETTSVTVVPAGNPCVEVVEGTYNHTNWLYPIAEGSDSSYSQTLYRAIDAASVGTLYGISFYVAPNGAVNETIDVYVEQTAVDSLTAPVPLAQLELAVQNFAFTPTVEGWYNINFTNPIELDGESNLLVSIAKHAGGSGDFEIDVLGQFNGRAWLDRGLGLNEYHGVARAKLLGGCSDDRCLQPLISATADLNSIEVEWDKRGGESQWLVQYRLENEVEWTDAGITSDFDGENHVSYVIEDMNASSRYEVRVAALCDDGDSVVSDSVSLATLCGAVSVPYSFDFTNGHSDCWQVPSGVVTADLYGENGGARMDDFMAQPRPIVSPEIDRDLNGLKVRYVVNGSDFFQPPVKIGVGDADGGNAVWLDSLVALDGSIEYTYYFNNFTGTQRHIVFYGEFGTKLRQVFIEENDECIPIHHIDVRHLMPTSAELQWQPAVDESEWAVYLDGALISVTSTPNYQITHNSELLTHNSSYTASVRAICGEGDTSTAVSVTFTTPCTPVTIPWNENFEAYATGDLSGCWRQYIRSFLGNTDANAHIRGTAAGNVLNLLDYAWAYNVTDTIIPNYVSSPLLVGDGGDMTVTFRAAFSTDPVGAGTCIAGVMTDVADTTSFIPLLGLTPVINCDYDVFYDYQFTIPGTLVDSPFALAFRWRGSVLTCFIDDIDIAYAHHDTVLRTVTLVANDPTMGSVTGDGEYMDSSYVSISAVANEGYSFVVWSDGDSTASRQIYVVSDTTLTAYFAATASIAEPITPNSEFRIYPNPASNTVTICRQDASGPVDILDVHGRVVQTIEHTAGQAIKLDISHLLSGAYFVRMTTDNRVVVKKLIVK